MSDGTRTPWLRQLLQGAEGQQVVGAEDRGRHLALGQGQQPLDGEPARGDVVADRGLDGQRVARAGRPA